MGGGTIKGTSKAGEIVWSRVYVQDNRLKVDLGTGSAIDLPAGEMDRRWKITTPQWPIMNAVLHGVTPEQLMARHKSNHVQVAYCDKDNASDALMAKAIAFRELGLDVFLCGSELP